jgi:hypothetical protein
VLIQINRPRHQAQAEFPSFPQLASTVESPRDRPVQAATIRQSRIRPRNQVRCRLAYCRVATWRRSRGLSVISPRRCATSSARRWPRGGRAGPRWGSFGGTSSSAPSAIIASKRRRMRAEPAPRGRASSTSACARQRQQGRAGIGLPVGQPAARGAQHLPGALHAGRVAEVDPRGRRGVEARQQRGRPAARQQRIGLGARTSGGTSRDLGQPFGQRREVKPRAPHDHHGPAKQQRRTSRSQCPTEYGSSRPTWP